jgi:hypothetical protein
MIINEAVLCIISAAGSVPPEIFGLYMSRLFSRSPWDMSTDILKQGSLPKKVF